MKTAYVVQQGGMVRRSGERLLVTSEGRVVAELRTDGLEQLVVVGNPTVTTQAIDLLVSRGVDTVLLATTGRFRARIGGAASGNVRLRLAQYALGGDAARSAQWVRAVVRGKIRNQRALLQKAARRQADERLAAAVKAMGAAMLGVEGAADVDVLRGLEGAAAAAYFKAFGALLHGDAFEFAGRRKRPPPDPINALLSLGYTLLAQRVQAAAEIVGLDPLLGVLHVPQANRPGLVLDLMETFRAPLVDALVVAAVNKGAIRPGHFDHAGAGEPVVLRREGMRTFVELFARRLEREVIDPGTGLRLAYRLVLTEECRRAARFLLDGTPLECFAVR